jgi:hypothetical protein
MSLMMTLAAYGQLAKTTTIETLVIAAGGTSGQNGGGGNGGTGIVVIRYASTFADAVSTTGSPSFSNSGGYKVYTFTGSGSIVF